MKHLLFSTLWLSLSAVPALPAQEPGPIQKIITEERVREVVTWLAHDDRQGRDTPSPGQEAAAEWLAQQFAAAGLEQSRKDSWFHDYTLPGLELDSAGIALALKRRFKNEEAKFELVPDVDVRLWRAGDVPSGELEPTTVASIGDPVMRQLLRARTGRRPIVIEVGEDHPYWLQSKGKRRVLAERRRAARPVFLVRDGLLTKPPGGIDEPGWAATWSAPVPEPKELPLKNVVALLPGSTRREEYIVVSAHYDHIGQGNPQNGDAIYNGADDDASGTTAVVLIAEALAKMPPPQRSILFVCFSAEEKGLRGSKAFVERPPVPREQIVANVNIEMIGRPEEGKQGMAWITGDDLSDFASIAAAAMARADVQLTEFSMASRLFAASDNFSFVRHGIVAHSVSAGSLHKDYHRPGDEVEKLDIPHMTQIIQGLAEFVRDLGNREAAPQWNELGKKRLEQLRK